MEKKRESREFDRSLVDRIIKGEIGVMPTDTIYGIVCDAMQKDSVERVYRICKRDSKKPFIVTIGKISDLELFGVVLTGEINHILKTLWPGRVSIILECLDERFEYLHRGLMSIAFRFPKEEQFLNFIKKTGPLVATSANPQGKKQANSIEQATNYFGDEIDFYVDGGDIFAKSSTLVRIKNNKIDILRSVSAKLNK